VALPGSTYSKGIVNPRIADVLERSDKMDSDQFLTAYSEVLSEVLNSKLGKRPTNLKKAVVMSAVYEATGAQCWWKSDFSGFTATKEPTYFWFRVRILDEGSEVPPDAGSVRPLKGADPGDQLHAAILRMQCRVTSKNDVASAGIPNVPPQIGDVVLIDLDQFPDATEGTYMGLLSGAGSPGMGFPGSMGMGFGGMFPGATLQAAKEAFVQGDPSKGTLGTTYEGMQGFTIMHPWGMQAVKRTSPFGMRCHPIKKPPKYTGPTCLRKGVTHTKTLHGGIDYAWRATPNAIMYACADGKVTYSKDKNPGSKSGGGYQVCLDMGSHPDAQGNMCHWTAWYVHMHPDTAAIAIKGKEFKEGEVIGIENNTGGSTGAHLHFGLYAKGHPAATDGKVDPEPFIDRLEPKGGIGAMTTGFGTRSDTATRRVEMQLQFTKECNGDKECVEQKLAQWDEASGRSSSRMAAYIKPASSTGG
jgi:hypothetical protein